MKIFFERTKSLILTNKIFSGSVVMIAGGFLGSFANYLFHLVVARRLGPEDYGILNSLISLLYEFSIPIATLTIVIVRYVAFFKGQKRQSAIQSLFFKINKKLIFLTPFLLVFFLILLPLISDFLRLPSPVLYFFLVLSFIISLFPAVGKSFLQGLSLFSPVAGIGVFESFFRLILTIILLLLGFGLLGAVFPYLIMSVISLLMTFYFTKNLLNRKNQEPIPEKKEIFNFILPVFLNNLGMTALITSDIILARHFLPAETAGLYSSVSTLGKIIYFAASPAISVILPVVSEENAAKKNSGKSIFYGLLIIGLISMAALPVFIFLPKLMILLLFGERYLSMEPFVPYFAVGIILYTFCAAFLNISLAKRAILPAVFVCLAAALQIVLLMTFHNSISQIITTFIVVCSLLLFSLLLYYWRHERD